MREHLRKNSNPYILDYDFASEHNSPMLRKFDGIILDIDGTIWNTTGIVAVAWNRAIEKSGLPVKKVTAQTLQKEFGKPMNVIAMDLWPDLSSFDREILLEKCCAFEQEELKNNQIDICYPGVVETIKELSASENFFVVSNCHGGYIELMLEKTGLAPFIKDFECYGRTLKAKAENIQLVMARNSLKSALYVGDTEGDAESSAQAGIPFVWASYGFGKVEKFYYKLDSFGDLVNLVK